MTATGMRRTAQRSMVYQAIVQLGGHCTADHCATVNDIGPDVIVVVAPRPSLTAASSRSTAATARGPSSDSAATVCESRCTSAVTYEETAWRAAKKGDDAPLAEAEPALPAPPGDSTTTPIPTLAPEEDDPPVTPRPPLLPPAENGVRPSPLKAAPATDNEPLAWFGDPEVAEVAGERLDPG